MATSFKALACVWVLMLPMIIILELECLNHEVADMMFDEYDLVKEYPPYER